MSSCRIIVGLPDEPCELTVIPGDFSPEEYLLMFSESVPSSVGEVSE